MEEHLKKTYGFNKFRPYQKDIINDLLSKENVVAILPTGGGKSLLYQFPATFTKKITVVVSPLISLMNDQCKYLNSRNIKTVCLNSESFVVPSEYCDYQIIYTTPEFITSRIKAFLKIKDNIGLFAIDEAHCISQWSHDFRPSYQKLSILVEQFIDVPLLAVTATATPRVLDEIYDYLNITEANEYSLGTRRTNLAISVRSKFEFAHCEFTQPTIVYVQTRKLCEKLHREFITQGISSAKYHGGMKKDEKEKSHELFINAKIMVIVATISYGMGIDKADIRHVVNYGVPANIESYYQEIGRAGRDGIESRATLYYDDNDFTTTAYLISLSTDESQIKIKTAGMNIFRNFLQEKIICRQQMIDYYFNTGKFANEKVVSDIPKCNKCDNCMRDDKPEIIDLSKHSESIVSFINNNKRKKSHDWGLKKIISLIQKNNTIQPEKSDKWVKDVIEILITKNILKRYKAGYGFVIGMGSVNLTNILPIKERIDQSISKFKFHIPENKLNKLMTLRNKLADKFNIAPSSFINDRVIMNIHDNSPKNITELWAIDGISDMFIMSPGCSEFMEEYTRLRKQVSSTKENGKENGKEKGKGKGKGKGKEKSKGKGRKGNRNNICELYKQGKSMKEMTEILSVKMQTIESHILDIYENNEDIEVDLNYFELTSKKQECINLAIKKVGTTFLKPIKDIVGKDVTYGQIKLCLLLNKM